MGKMKTKLYKDSEVIDMIKRAYYAGYSDKASESFYYTSAEDFRFRVDKAYQESESMLEILSNLEDLSNA